eukprot:3678228-Rhodomonas_salina.1
MSVGSQVVERNLPLTLEELYRGAQVQYAICLHPRYAVSGTSLLYRATNPHHFHCLVYVFTVRCLVLTSRIHIVAVSIPLRTHLSGTDTASGATTYAIFLRTHYAVSGTDEAYAPRSVVPQTSTPSTRCYPSPPLISPPRSTLDTQYSTLNTQP